MLRSHLSRGATAALGLALVGASVAIPATAQAAGGRVAGCHWIVGDRLNTFDCGRLDSAVDTVNLVDCWKYRPPADTYVVHKTANGWVKGGTGLRTRQGGGCPDHHPWRTVVTVSTAGLKPMQSAYYRLVMPASSGTDGGTAYSFAETTLTYGVCLVREGSAVPCGAAR